MESSAAARGRAACCNTVRLTPYVPHPNIVRMTDREYNHTFFDTVDTLLGAVSWTKRRMVLVFHREHGCRRYIQMRTFNQHQTKGCWYPTGRFYTVPIECAAELGRALLAAARGIPFGKQPDWYADFDKQYQAMKAQAKAKRQSGPLAGALSASGENAGDGLVGPAV